MLLSQGWTPGQTLGAVDSAHAQFHTKASFSHIRTLLREDNLGLGAKIGSGQAAGECTGLDAFQNLLGRLNGKSDEVLQKEQSSRDAFKRGQYLEQKLGGRRWVSGGLLVGNKVDEEEVGDADDKVLPVDAQASTENQDGVVQSPERGTKKRGKDEMRNSTEKAPKKKRKEKSISKQTDIRDAEVAKKSQAIETEEFLAEAPTNNDKEARRQEKARRKEERAKRREDKAQRKLDRRRRREAKAIASDGQDSTTTPSTEHDTEAVTTAPSTETSQPPTPGGFTMGGGRHVVRRRYIQQKKMAMMDPMSLNEVSSRPLRRNS